MIEWPLKRKYRSGGKAKKTASPGSNSGSGKRFRGPINWRKGSGIKDSNRT